MSFLPGMFPFAAVASGAAVTTFVGADVVDGAALAISWPSGTQAGDAAIICVVGNGAPSWSNFSGWATDVNGGVVSTVSLWYCYSKILSAGDVSTPPSYTGATAGGYIVAVYRGATSITFKTSLASDAGSDAALSGFVKAALSSRVVTAICDRDPGNDMTEPSGFTQRHEEAISFFDYAVADIAAGSYTNSASITWTNLATSFTQAAVSWEIV